MINTNELKKRIKDSGYMCSYIAKCLSISKQSLSNKINGKTEFSGNEIKVLAKLLQLTSEDICKIFFALEWDSKSHLVIEVAHA